MLNYVFQMVAVLSAVGGLKEATSKITEGRFFVLNLGFEI